MADSGDGQPYETRSDTPDQQGAGVVNPPTMTPYSLLNVLGGMGGGAAPPPPPPGLPPAPPPGLGGGGMGSLLSMLPPPVSQASVYAQALSGGISAMRGTPDPVQAIVHQQQQQQNVISGMLMKMQEQQDLNNYRKTLVADRDREFRLQTDKFAEAKTQAALKKNEAALVTMQGVLDNPNTPPAAVAILGPQYAAKMKETFGVDVPNAISQRVMKGDEQDQVLMQIHEGLPPEIILKNHPSLTPEDLQSFTGIKDNPAVLERLKLKSPQDREEQSLRIRGLNADLLEKEHPELRLDPKTGAAVLMKAQTMYPNQTYADLTPEVRGRLYAQTVLEQQAQTLAMERAKAETQASVALAKLPQELAMRGQAALSLEQQKQQLKTVGDSKEYYVDAKGNLAPSDMTIPEARRAGFNVTTQVQMEALKTGQQAMLILSNIKDTVNEMKDEKLFVSKSGLPGMVQQGIIAAQGKYGDPEVSKRLLANFESQKGHIIILMRLLGEKGIRAMAGMLPAMEQLSPAKGAPAVEQFLGNLESELRILGVNSKAPEAMDSMPMLFPRRPARDIVPPTLRAPSNEWKIEAVPD
jgi:hypothetical protein